MKMKKAALCLIVVMWITPLFAHSRECTKKKGDRISVCKPAPKHIHPGSKEWKQHQYKKDRAARNKRLKALEQRQKEQRLKDKLERAQRLRTKRLKAEKIRAEYLAGVQQRKNERAKQRNKPYRSYITTRPTREAKKYTKQPRRHNGRVGSSRRHPGKTRIVCNARKTKCRRIQIR
jgi:hypothetical protein